MGRQRELARLLAALRREGRQQSGLAPELVPPDTSTAYRVAQMVEEEIGLAVIGSPFGIGGSEGADTLACPRVLSTDACL